MSMIGIAAAKFCMYKLCVSCNDRRSQSCVNIIRKVIVCSGSDKDRKLSDPVDVLTVKKLKRRPDYG